MTAPLLCLYLGRYNMRRADYLLAQRQARRLAVAAGGVGVLVLVGLVAWLAR